MTKRIFRSICLAALFVFLAAVLLFMGVLYDYFSGLQRSQLRTETKLAAQGAAGEGPDYFEDLDINNCRITWIAKDGTVLYDSESNAAEMENHLEREEIREAMEQGIGESDRYSSTLTERSFYCARQLPDGTILRLSMVQSTLLTLLVGMLQPIFIIFIFAVILSMLLASRLSRKIVQPLNALNLDAPLDNEGYDELSPLLRRLDHQQRQIRQQREELQKQQNEFEAITRSMAEGIVLLNDKSIILTINPAAARILGVESDSSPVGRDMLTINRSLELAALLQEAVAGSHAEKVLSVAGRRYQADATPVFSEGQISGMVLLLLDITEKEASERMRREFTANVSHELKTPLHTISGSAELMMNGLVKAEDVPDFSKRIYSESQRMIRLIEDIIRLSHLDEGAPDLKREPANLYAAAEEVLRQLEDEAKSAGVTLSLQGGPAVVEGVPQLIHEILYNLCDNAVKYNRPDGSVTITVRDGEDGASVTVADTGIGIAPEHQERIFERFYRVDKSHSKQTGGTGLGLSIVKHAARLLGASITLNSTPGRGTEITVSFPRKPEA